MPTSRRLASPGFAAVAVLYAASLGAVEVTNAHLEPAHAWSSFFAGDSAKISFAITSTQALTETAAWSVAIGGTVVARREAQLSVLPARPTLLEVPVELPKDTGGTVLQAVVVASFGRGATTARREKTIWIYPRDPFASETTWLRGLKIALLDPPPGRTAEVFRKTGVPFVPVKNVGGISQSEHGSLIVGEGISFRERPRLAHELAALASRGTPVLCLAPADGIAFVPGISQGEVPFPDRVSLGGTNIIAAFDKRFDSVEWPSDGRIVKSAIRFEPSRTSTQARVAPDGWPWIEAAFAKRPSGGTIIYCGFAIIEKWESGPTPRYLFREVLKSINPRE